MGQRGTTKVDLQSKLNAVADQMYAVTYEVKEAQVPVESGESEATGETETVEYVVCTIHPFDQSVILKAFGVDVDATYDQFNITYGEAILNMSNALKMTMYGTTSDGSVPPISDAELNLFLASLDCSGKRKELMRCALSLVGRVPYFWGGKSAPGWNSEWNTPKLVTAAGSSSTGTIRPYGLDCSGFTEWVYQTALGVTLYDGSWNQWDATLQCFNDLVMLVVLMPLLALLQNIHIRVLLVLIRFPVFDLLEHAVFIPLKGAWGGRM